MIAMLVMEVLICNDGDDGFWDCNAGNEDSRDYNADDGGSGDCSAVMEVVMMSL